MAPQRRKPYGSGASDLSPTLFESAARNAPESTSPSPLADRMRPADMAELVGQEHLVGPGRALAEAIAHDRLSSSILWGPPGSGKTSLARIIAGATRARFVPYSAVLGTLPELREILQEAKKIRAYEGRRTILFIDEIHRFNKGQQDAFLPYVEEGTIVLVGATTENPSFAINSALLSRCTVFRLERLSEQALVSMLERALGDAEHGLGKSGLKADRDAIEAIARLADGDGRRALNALEAAAAYALAHAGAEQITLQVVARGQEHRPLLYDKTGDEHYNVVSAFIKSMRGSDPDAAIYWAMRMLEAGDDPLFVLRRILIFASEDIGNADPRALQLAVAADAAFRRMGMPEGIYPIAQAVLYMSLAPKSNSVGRAFSAAKQAIEQRGTLPVPVKLRNAPTQLMKDMGYAEQYRYPHEDPDHYDPNEKYLPRELLEERFFEPGPVGVERQFWDRLERIRAAKKPPDG